MKVERTTGRAEKQGRASSQVPPFLLKVPQAESQSVGRTAGQSENWMKTETLLQVADRKLQREAPELTPRRAGWRTSHLLLQAQYDLHGLLQDDQLGLRLVALQVDLTHPAQLSEGLVNVAHAHPLPSVVGQSALALPLLLLLGREVLIAHWDKAAAGWERGGRWVGEWQEGSRGRLTNPELDARAHTGAVLA